jgi:hypothetical protein
MNLQTITQKKLHTNKNNTKQIFLNKVINNNTI